ncbi:MAG: GAF domain-containing protein [Candidatus Cloacimonetes bacterium]|nr:GAF domain-containing protein [Candidatus Cloacimonadota bacterium]
MDQTRKADRYLRVYGQLHKLLSKTADPAARMATICAVLHHKFDYYFWTGFYRLIEGELTVACYQGPVACLVLAAHTGVCWAGIDGRKNVIVEDVNKFPEHIACDSRSVSEIVIPVYDATGEITAVFDVDSRELAAFDETDAEWLAKVVELIYRKD